MMSLLESESQSDLWWGGVAVKARAGVMITNTKLLLFGLCSDIKTTWEDLIQAAQHRCVPLYLPHKHRVETADKLMCVVVVVCILRWTLQ